MISSNSHIPTEAFFWYLINPNKRCTRVKNTVEITSWNHRAKLFCNIDLFTIPNFIRNESIIIWIHLFKYCIESWSKIIRHLLDDFFTWKIRYIKFITLGIFFVQNRFSTRTLSITYILAPKEDCFKFNHAHYLCHAFV